MAILTTEITSQKAGLQAGSVAGVRQCSVFLGPDWGGSVSLWHLFPWWITRMASVKSLAHWGPSVQSFLHPGHFSSLPFTKAGHPDTPNISGAVSESALPIVLPGTWSSRHSGSWTWCWVSGLTPECPLFIVSAHQLIHQIVHTILNIGTPSDLFLCFQEPSMRPDTEAVLRNIPKQISKYLNKVMAASGPLFSMHSLPCLLDVGVSTYTVLTLTHCGAASQILGLGSSRSKTLYRVKVPWPCDWIVEPQNAQIGKDVRDSLVQLLPLKE